MSEFVKRTMIGYKDLAGGHSDPECTHVILTLKEYDDLLKEISRAKRETREEKSKAADAQKESQRELNNTVQQYKQAIEKWREALNEAQTEIAYQKGMNENLLRIARERANADRKLKPKKEHTGYSVVLSTEKEYRYGKGKDMTRVMLWETVIQSPYSIDFPEGLIRKQITDELTQVNEAGDKLINRIGIDSYYPGSYASLLQKRMKFDWYGEPEDEEEQEEPMGENVMLKLHFRANFRAGYWEAVFFHIKPLGIVPLDMRAK